MMPNRVGAQRIGGLLDVCHKHTVVSCITALCVQSSARPFCFCYYYYPHAIERGFALHRRKP